MLQSTEIKFHIKLKDSKIASRTMTEYFHYMNSKERIIVTLKHKQHKYVCSLRIKTSNIQNMFSRVE